MPTTSLWHSNARISYACVFRCHCCSSSQQNCRQSFARQSSAAHATHRSATSSLACGTSNSSQTAIETNLVCNVYEKSKNEKCRNTDSTMPLLSVSLGSFFKRISTPPITSLASFCIRRVDSSALVACNDCYEREMDLTGQLLFRPS